MNLSVGIVGLPNVGKSTLFNALVSAQKATVAAHPFTTIDKNIGVVEIPDETLFELAKTENIAKVTPATITFIDIAGLIKGANKGEGLGNQFLHHIREVDLILHVVRFFQNENVAHVHSKIDPDQDIAVVEEELLLADLQSLKKQLEDKKIDQKQKELVEKLIDKLDQGVPAREVELTKEEKEALRQLNLLTAKKQIVVANIAEEQIKNPPSHVGGRPTLLISAKLESETAQLDTREQQEFLKLYGLPHGAREAVILTCYKALDLITFYTIAKKTQARAWPLQRGKTALNAAAKIHTDFAQHFIKVEQINAEELIKEESWQKAHQAGKVLAHGKEYVVRDQDVLEFKIST